MRRVPDLAHFIRPFHTDSSGRAEYGLYLAKSGAPTPKHLVQSLHKGRHDQTDPHDPKIHDDGASFRG